MKTREGRGLQVGPATVGPAGGPERVGARPQQLDVRAAHTEPVRPGRLLALGVVGGLVAILLVTLGLVWAVGGGQGVRTATDTPADDAPAAPAPLTVDVVAPVEVVAGEEAEFVVSWSDGSGVFSGTLEDWGDVGVGSVKQEPCDPTAAPAGPQSDTFVLSHTWKKAGTYQVVLGVTTVTCAGADTVAEDASRTLTVEVLPAR